MKSLLRHKLAILACSACWALSLQLPAQVPNLVSHQGRVAVNGVNFNGTGQFKFALVNGNGAATYWSNAPDVAPADGVPDAEVSLPVNKGLYSVMLGEGMTPVPASVFQNPDVRLRVWFNDGITGFQQLSPDQRLAPNGYLPSGAISAGNLADGSITTAKIAAGTIIPSQAFAGTSYTMATNASYISTSSSPTTLTLPSSASIGDVVEIRGSGAGEWSVVPQSGQFIAASWIARDIDRDWRAVASSADGNKLVAVVQNGKIYTSTDSGRTWEPRGSDQQWSSVASSADGSKLVAVASGGQIHTSTDSGVTWTARAFPTDWRSVASSADGSKLVAIGQGQIHTSTDSGVTWALHGSYNPYWASVASSADGNMLAVANENGQIHTSTDSGITWIPRGPNLNSRAVASSADGYKLVAAVSNGLVYTSTDAGVTWYPRWPDWPQTMNPWSSVASSADGSKLAAVPFSGRIYTSIDSGATWRTSGRNEFWTSVASSADGNKLVAVCQNGKIYTLDTTVRGGQGQSATLQYLGNGEWGKVADNELQADSLTGSIPSASLTSVPAANLTGSVPSSALTSVPAANLTGSVPPASLTSVPAASLTGLISDVRLSSNVALRAGGNYFTGNQIFDGQFANTGNAGIGTALPQARLHVYSPDSPTVMRLHSAASPGAGRLEFLSNPQGNEWRPGYIESTGDGSFTGGLSFVVNGTGSANKFGAVETMRLVNGKVGIGTSAPGSLLQLGDTGIANSQGMIRFASRSGTGFSSRYWDIGVPEGDENTSGKNYSFVIDDPTSGGDPEMTIRWDTGNVGLGTASPQGRLHLYSAANPTVMRVQSSGAPGFGRLEFVSNPQGDTNEWRPAYIQSTDSGSFTGGLAFVVNGSGSVNKFAEVETMRIQNGRVGIGTTTPVSALHVNGTVTATAFNPPSDRNLKENFETVDSREVLDKVAALPISRWNFKGDAETPHIGPMAQDFHAAFGTGTDDKHIATVDADGVALAAIQGLNEKLEEKESVIAELRNETSALREKNEAMETRLAALEELLSRQQTARTKANSNPAAR